MLELTDEVRSRLDLEEDPPTLAQNLRCLAEFDESEAVDILGVFIDHPESAVSEAATVGLLAQRRHRRGSRFGRATAVP